MFGDNESVVTSSTIPHSQLNKRWTALSYHRVREAIAAQVFEFWHVPGDENPADIVSKHWAYNKVSHVLRPLMFWRGDTLDSNQPSCANFEEKFSSQFCKPTNLIFDLAQNSSWNWTLLPD